MADDEFNRVLPRLDDFPSPMHSKKRKRVEILESGREKEANPVLLETKGQTSAGQDLETASGDTLPNTRENGTEKQVRFRSPSPSTRPSEATQQPPSSALASRTAQQDLPRVVASSHVQHAPKASACVSCNEALPPWPLKTLPEGLPAGVKQKILNEKRRVEEADVMYFNVLLTKRKKACDFERTKYNLDLLSLQMTTAPPRR
jgi:hypothetical protein